jgi:hypothetical protein
LIPHFQTNQYVETYEKLPYGAGEDGVVDTRKMILVVECTLGICMCSENVSLFPGRVPHRSSQHILVVYEPEIHGT